MADDNDIVLGAASTLSQLLQAWPTILTVFGARLDAALLH